jgi:putative ABC transport system permease protein
MLLHDVQFAQRSLRRSIITTVILVLTIALGVGANAAILTMTSAILWRQLPYRQPTELVSLWSRRTDRDKAPVSIADAQDFRVGSALVQDIAVYAPMGANLVGMGDPERIEGILGSPNVFHLLGVEPAVGRLLNSVDGPRTIVLGHALWQRSFGGNPAIVGQPVVLNGQGYVVAGILRPDFTLPVRVDFVVPMNPDTDPRRLDRGDHYLTGLARLRTGASTALAEQQLNAVARRLQTAYPSTNSKNSGVRVIPLSEEIVGNFGPSLRILSGAAGVLLLLACSSLASLSLARIAARQNEFAIRSSLGAGLSTIAHQLVIEASLVALAGGGTALAVGCGGLELLKSLSPPSLPRLAEVHIDSPQFAANIMLALLIGGVLGVIGALAATRTQPADALKSGARTMTGGAGLRVRTILSGVQLALAVVLLVGAGLLLRSFARLQSVDPGFTASDALVLRLALMPPSFPDNQSIATFHETLRTELQRIGGVESAGAISALPLSGLLARADFAVAGRPPLSPEDTPSANYRVIGPGYLRAMHIPIVAGRDIADTDTARTQPVAWISQALARRYFPDGGAVGAHLDISGFGSGIVEIAGIVGDVQQTALTDGPSMDLYLPYAQAPRGTLNLLRNNMFWVIRARNAAALERPARNAVRAAQKDVAVSTALPLEQYRSRSLAPRRFNFVLLAAFAAAALMLAAVSVYGVMAHSVTLRSRELALRMVLGAQRSDVLLLVLRQSVALTSCGVAAGIAAALALTRVLATLLYQTEPLDLATFTVVAVVLLITGVLASYFPAVRATRSEFIAQRRTESW